MNIVSSNIDQTLTQFLSQYTYVVDIKTILDTADPITGVTNFDRIKRKYNAKELTDNESKYPNGDILVKAGTPIDLRNVYIKRNIPKQVPSELFQSTDFKPFIAKQLVDLLKDPNYRREIKNESGQVQATIDNNDITVFIWSRALTSPNDNSQKGTWINVSPFIQNITTSVNSDMGTFSFNLSPISAEFYNNLGWGLSGDTIGYEIDSQVNAYDVLSKTSILKYNPTSSGETWREKFLFDLILQENDLVFIKFEKLVVDGELFENNNTSIDQKIPFGIWDMIGLIDSVSTSTSINSSIVNVNGRDLMKLLIEDGSYFFPEQFAQNIFTNENSILTKRNRFELEAQSVASASYTFKSIETILKFIFNKFSNIGIVPNGVFSGYGNLVSKNKYQLKGSSLKRNDNGDIVNQLNSSFLNEERQGVWRICEFIFDSHIANRVLADNSISQDNGSIINSIRKVCQEPFVEFYGDTYKNKYYFIVHKPPFDYKGYTGMVYDNVITEEKTSVNLNNRIGSDDKNLSYISSNKEIRSNGFSLEKESTLSDLVIDIEDYDVLSEQFTYHNEAYSWYRIIPTGLGIPDETARFEFAPVIALDEYAEVFGNKMYNIEYNYCPTEYLKDSQEKSEAKFAEAQAFYDLQFVIQSHQYLPFTRKGVIVLTGNRTIKRGLFIYYKPTKEVFYVDSVSHSRSMGIGSNNRTTVVQVSRGMREQFIKGKFVNFPSGTELVSYFNIVNTAIDNRADINNKNFLKNWRVNKNIFNFFLQRRQWVD